MFEYFLNAILIKFLITSLLFAFSIYTKCSSDENVAVPVPIHIFTDYYCADF